MTIASSCRVLMQIVTPAKGHFCFHQLISPFMPTFLSCHHFLTRRATALSKTARLSASSAVPRRHHSSSCANVRNDRYVIKRMKSVIDYIIVIQKGSILLIHVRKINDDQYQDSSLFLNFNVETRRNR